MSFISSLSADSVFVSTAYFLYADRISMLNWCMHRWVDVKLFASGDCYSFCLIFMTVGHMIYVRIWITVEPIFVISL